MSTYSDRFEQDQPQEERSSMSFLEHLDELRKRLVNAAIFIALAFTICWIFSDKIYHFLETPVRKAMVEARIMAATPVDEAAHSTLSTLADGQRFTFTFQQDTNVGDILVPKGTSVVAEIKRAKPNDQSEQPGVVTAEPIVVSENAIIAAGYLIPRRLLAPDAVTGGADDRLIVLTVTGAFNLYLKVSFYAAIFFSVPFLLWQAWAFISPGLYEHEKKYAIPFLVMASGFFLLGCAFAYYIAFPRAANYLLGVAAQGNLKPQVTADDYFDLINTIMLGLGLVFEIPTITFFLSRIGLVNHRMLLVIWRYAIIVIMILAAVLSPTTDIPNMMIFAAPMLLLYFLSVGIAWVFYHRRQKREGD
ncbi:MAG: twin-arginine translocase subunit TatC [Blastocatellia bacterium]